MSESYCQGLSLSSYCPVGIVHCLIYPVCETLKTVSPVLTFRPYSFIWSFNQHFLPQPPHGSMDYRLSGTDTQLTPSKSSDLYRKGEDRKV